MKEQDLLKLKKEIDEGKSEVERLKGRKEYLMQQLKKEWKCDDLEQADKKLKEYEKEIEKTNTQIEEGVEELKEKYEFIEEE